MSAIRGAQQPLDIQIIMISGYSRGQPTARTEMGNQNIKILEYIRKLKTLVAPGTALGTLPRAVKGKLKYQK